MRLYLPLVLAVLLLTNLLVFALMWGQQAYLSANTYRSPLRAVDLPPLQLDLPTGNRLVLVIVNNLSYDLAVDNDLPTFALLRQRGAFRAMISTPPTNNQTMWATILTGATAELNDAPLLDRSVNQLYALETDTLLANVTRQGGQTAIFGPPEFLGLLPGEQISYRYVTNGLGQATDEALLNNLTGYLQNQPSDLVVIQFTALTPVIGQGEAAELQAALTAVDQQIADILTLIDLDDTVLAVVGDHGTLGNGNFGGDELAVVQTPLILAGGNVVPGEYTFSEQRHIAPTLATLMGMAVPNKAQGEIMFELLDLPQTDRLLAQLVATEQRIALAEAYLSLYNRVYTPASETTETDKATLQSLLGQKNYDGAFELAALIQQRLDTEMALAHQNRRSQDQLWRLAVAAFVVTGWGYFMWRFRTPYSSVSGLAVLLTAGSYYVLYQIQGNSYTFSYVSDLTELPIAVARRGFVSLFVGTLFIFLIFLLARETDWVRLVRTGYGFMCGVAWLVALPMAFAFWQNGLETTIYPPDMAAAFWQATAILEMIVVSTIGLVLPWLLMSITLFINLLRQATE